MAAGATIAVRRHDGAGHRFEIASRPPAAPLAGLVRAYVGYTEHAAETVRRLQVPFSGLPLIISFGPSIHIAPSEAPSGTAERGRTVTSFLAGLHAHAVVTQYRGAQAGVQADLTPLGAAVLFSGVVAEAANRVVDLADVLGADAGRLADRLAGAADWAARFALLDTVLLAKLAAARRPPPEVEHAFARLAASHGTVPVARLAEETGWSAKHLSARVRGTLGLGPKTLGRIARFERAIVRLDGPDTIADVAAACGYADQAHLTHEFRLLAGQTPAGYRAARHASALGVTAP